jgi:hypothetical protein
LARVLNKDWWSITQNNNNMKTTKNTSPGLVIWLLVLLTTLSFSIKAASASYLSKNSEPTSIASEKDIKDLLVFAQIDEDVEIVNIYIKIYDLNDELIYSDEVCHNEYNCDDRLNQLLNQSDFITEIDNIKIYILNQ